MKKTVKNKILIIVLILFVGAGVWFFLFDKNTRPTAIVVDNMPEKIEPKLESNPEEMIESDLDIEWVLEQPISQDSLIKRYGKKVWWAHDGKIKIKEWKILIKEDKVVWWEVIIDMDTISVDDIENPTSNQWLVDHLKNQDFFDVENYPTSKFEIKSIENNNKIIWDMTIKGITKTIEIPATIDKTDDSFNIYTKFSIDRTMRDIMYWSTDLISTIKDKAIDNIIEFEINIE